jgi:K+-sensing histidine kinase KdpD
MPDSLGWRGHPVVENYEIPVLSVAAVLVIERWLDLYFSAALVSLFICAITLSAWLGGFGPGLFATALSLLAFKSYFVPPFYSLAPATAEAPRLVLFSVTALFVVSVSAGQRNAAKALRASEQRFRDFAETASDWLWETGPEHSFTRVSEGDRIQLQQVLLNLLMNAAAAAREVPVGVAPTGRAVDLRTARGWPVGGRRGGGCRGRLWAGRGGPSARGVLHDEAGGLGMGLLISRSIIESHRGRLWATANPARGATFHLALPGTQ